ncbi:matrix metallopeptidase-21 isoform X2 [Narcine bancroftii]|uniref:matrix metallopeptidase-21 isoform X2 n=1 Tax=Narcine bancroftii TaxID=1343680 RepID=UPI003831B6BB
MQKVPNITSAREWSSFDRGVPVHKGPSRAQVSAISMRTAFRVLAVCILCSANGEKPFHRRDHSDVAFSPQRWAPRVLDPLSAEQYLSKYGWTQRVNWENVKNQSLKNLADEHAAPKDLLDLIEEGSSASKQKEESPVEPIASTVYREALKQFQKANSIPMTGEFDKATKEAMNKPRCGVPDKVLFNGILPDDETSIANPTVGANSEATDVTVNSKGRRKRFLQLLFSPTPRMPPFGSDADNKAVRMAFSKSKLTWRLMGESYSNQLPVEHQKLVLKMAFRMWSEVIPLEFEENTDSPASMVDIKLGFGKGRHMGCTRTFDGNGQEFAHSWQFGDIHFDDDDHFTIPSDGNGISLLKVAVHEIGHVLGLPHSYRTGSVMQPSYIPQESTFELDWLDRKDIQQLYGICESPFDTIFDWIHKDKNQYGELMIQFNTYFFRNELYWLYENRNNRTRYGDPITISIGWQGLPSNGIDAIVHIWTWTRDAIYFFKGMQYWRYDNENDQTYTMDTEGNRYPMLISEGFPGVKSPVDAAFYDRRDQHIYFFKGSNVTAFNVNTNQRSTTLVSRFEKIPSKDLHLNFVNMVAKFVKMLLIS